MSTCVLVVLVMAWCLGGHHLAKRSRHFTEGSAACALGLATGLVLLVFHHYTGWSWVNNLLEFNAAGFFTWLLPPVIFYCGLSVEHERFFYALPSILLYGVFGTLASFAIISLFMYGALGFALFKLEDCLAMGAIFAATDSVATLQVLDRNTMPGLFSLVFGEGVVNDAVSVVLLGAVANTARAHEAAAAGGAAKDTIAGGVVFNFVYLLVLSLLLGAASGLGIAVALRRLTLTEAHQELAVITLLSYFSYLLADVTGLSGILALFVCGVVVSHYALNNVSEEGQAATLTSFRTASYLAEGIIFLYVGMDALDPLKWQGANAAEAVWLVLVLTALLAAARAAFVVPFSLLHNIWSADKLSSRDIVVVWWAGLMRGAVSVALVYYYFDDNPRQVLDRSRATLIVSTLMVVMISILGFGALTKPLLAAMLKGEREASLRDQLRTIPLLSTLAHNSSSANSFIEQLDNSFRPHRGGQAARQGSNSSSSGGGSQHGNGNSRNNGNNGSRRGPPPGGGGSGVAGAVDSSRGGGRVWGAVAGVARSSGRMWGAAGGPAAAAAVPAGPADGSGGFDGFDVDGAALQAAEEYDSADAALISINETGAAASTAGGPAGSRSAGSLSFSRFLPGHQQQQQQQQQSAGAAAVELQQGGLQGAAGGSSAAAGGGTVLVAMRQMGEAWGHFDRDVMRPLFGGPGSRPSSSENIAGQQQPQPQPGMPQNPAGLGSSTAGSSLLP
ncbi:hypothetical protein OEZ86_000348 [Tetradesmus obliquus]|nr:hypothetical protein OEZ86_000348 [Tetradesmus obliquus]